MNKKLNLYAVSDTKLSDAFDRVIVKIYLQKKQKGSKSYMFCGVNPRAGATTLAMNVAMNLATSGWRTVLLDGDMRKSVKLKKINDEVDVGLADYLAKEAPYEDVVYKTNYTNMYCIPCGENISNPVQMLCSPMMKELFEKMKEDFDYIIVDVPSFGSAVDAGVIAAHIDETILVASQGRTEKNHIEKCRAELKNAGANIFGIIMNRVDELEYKNHMKNYDYFTKGKYVHSAQKRKQEHKEGIIKKKIEE